MFWLSGSYSIFSVRNLNRNNICWDTGPNIFSLQLTSFSDHCARTIRPWTCKHGCPVDNPQTWTIVIVELCSIYVLFGRLLALNFVGFVEVVWLNVKIPHCTQKGDMSWLLVENLSWKLIKLNYYILLRYLRLYILRKYFSYL